MGRLIWYKRDPDRALGGMMNLTLEERGAYNTVLDLIYSKDDELRDDDRFIAGWCNCDLRVWRRLKSRLVELGKITIVDGFVRNFRATSGVTEALGRVLHASEAAKIKWEKYKSHFNEINGLADAGGEEQHMHHKKKNKKESKIPPAAPSGASAPPHKKADKILPLFSGGTNGTANPKLYPLPADWRPSQAEREFAQDLGLDPDVICESFVDYWTSSKGCNVKRPGWTASWHTWCRRDADKPVGRHVQARGWAGNSEAGAFARAAGRLAGKRRDGC